MIQTIAERIVDKVDDEMKPQIIHWAAHYVSSAAAREASKLNGQELRMRLGSKKIFHIEAFIAKVMR
jgi:replication factor C subunit 3/5